MNFPLRFLRLLHCAVYAMIAGAAVAQPGDLDLDFNPPGSENMPGIVTALPAANPSILSKIALLPDGKILGIGWSVGIGWFNGVALARWLPDGRVDLTFGIDGIARSALSHAGKMKAITLQPDGKILIAGDYRDGGYFYGSVLRFLPDGMLDSSFGDGGRVILRLPDFMSLANSLAVLGDGKLLVGGAVLEGDDDDHYDQFHIWKMLPDGSPDQSFGYMGGVTYYGLGEISQIVMQPDGKIVATGSNYAGAGGRWVARVEANGDLDSTFAGGGRFALDPDLRMRNYTKLALQKDGKILVAGDSLSGSFRGFIVKRFHPNGSPDVSFRNGLTNNTSFEKSVEALSVQDDGKVLVAGNSLVAGGSFESVLARLQTNGDPDPGFGTGGIAKFELPDGSAELYDMLAQPDGKILMAGTAFQQSSAMLLLRYAGVNLSKSLSVEWPVGTVLEYGGEVQLTPVVRGDITTPETTLTFRNTSAARLTNLSAAISGPGAAHFELLSPHPSVLESGASTTLSVRFLPAAVVSDFTAALVIDTGNPEIEDFLIVLRGETQLPVASLTLSEAALPVSADATVEFGPVLEGQSLTKTFTLKSTGNIALTIQDISLAATGTPGEFTLDAPGAMTLAPGEMMTFSVRFAPVGPGARTATLRISSTDSLNPPYALTLSGNLASGIDRWWLTRFGTSFTEEGDAADLGDPDHDGVPNLMEYATFTDPDIPGPPPGELKMIRNLLEYTFMMPAGAADRLRYSLEWSFTPQGPWSELTSAPLAVLSDDGTKQHVKISRLIGPGVARFFVRLRVDRK